MSAKSSERVAAFIIRSRLSIAHSLMINMGDWKRYGLISKWPGLATSIRAMIDIGVTLNAARLAVQKVTAFLAALSRSSLTPVRRCRR